MPKRFSVVAWRVLQIYVSSALSLIKSYFAEEPKGSFNCKTYGKFYVLKPCIKSRLTALDLYGAVHVHLTQFNSLLSSIKFKERE
jgi:hypothetical protein